MPKITSGQVRKKIIPAIICFIISCSCCGKDKNPTEPELPMPTGDFQARPTNDEGIATFSDTRVLIRDVNSKEPVQAIDVIYYNMDDAKVFLAKDPDKRYFPKIAFFEHNSDHILDMNPIGALTYVLERLSDEDTMEALMNFIDNLSNPSTICEAGSGLYYLGTYTGAQIASQEKTETDIYLIIPILNNSVSIISTVADKVADIEDIVGGSIDFESSNWDKYQQMPQGDMSAITTTASGYILRASQAPTVTLREPEISENSVTLSWYAQDRLYYPDGALDATITCKGSTTGMDLSYWFKISNSSYNNWTASSTTDVTVSVPSGSHEAQVKVKDDTNLNEDLSSVIPFATQGGEELDVMAEYSFAGSIFSGITFDGSNIWTSDIGSGTLPAKIYMHNSDMSIARTYNTSIWPTALEWSGSHMFAYDVTLNEVYKLDSEMNVVDTYDVASTHTYLGDIAWKEDDMWSSYVIPDQKDKIYKFDSSINVVAEYESPGNMALGCTWHGAFFYLYCGDEERVFKLDGNMNELSMYSTTISVIDALAADDNYLWAVDLTSTIYKIRIP